MSLYRDAKDGEVTGIIVENKHINGLETNLECVIIKFNHGVSVFLTFIAALGLLLPE